MWPTVQFLGDCFGERSPVVTRRWTKMAPEKGSSPLGGEAVVREPSGERVSVKILRKLMEVIWKSYGSLVRPCKS